MMSYAVLAILALGIDSTGAFHAPRLVTTRWSRTTELSSMNDLYGAPSPEGESGFTNDQVANAPESFPLDMQSEQPLAVGAEAPERLTPTPPDSDSSVLVQGGSLRTWSYRSHLVEQVQVVLGTEGRPLDADIELWHGPDNTPCKMRVYIENGQLRPFSAVIETPRGPNSVAIRNIGQIEFPIFADVSATDVEYPSDECLASSATIQGGAIRTYPFDALVDSIQVLLRTDGRPLNARIELLQGPNNNKQVVELYTEDGADRPFFCILESPGSGNVVRIVNTAPVEFPMSAAVVPHSINQEWSVDTPVLGGDVVLGGDIGW